jgi:GT2 family glycosyltransferase
MHDQAMKKSAIKIGELEATLDDILNSTSWKMTQPYRWLGSRTSEHLLTPLQSSKDRFLQNFPILNSKSSSGTSEQGLHETQDKLDSKIHYSLETEPGICQHKMHLKGWAVAIDRLITISVSIDGMQYLTFSPSHHRQDVGENYPAFAHAVNSGFDETLSLMHLDGGVHELLIEFKTPSGLQELYRCTFYLFSENELYNAWLQLKQATFSTSLESADHNTDSQPSSDIHLLLYRDNDEDSLSGTIASLLNQSYLSWKIHSVGLTPEALTSSVDESDAARLITRLTESVIEHDDIQDALNSLKNLDGYFVCLRAGEILAPHALEVFVESARSTEAKLIYSDHDMISEAAEHHSPEFTFSWSPEHLYSKNYIGGIYLASTDLLDDNLNLDFGGAWRFSLLLNLSHNSANVERISQVLWSTEDSAVQSESQTNPEECKALQSYFSHRGINADVSQAGSARYINWATNSSPKVSIIMPTMGKLSLIKPCIESLVRLTEYQNYEVIVLDNSRGKNPEGIEYLKDRDFTVIECDEDFNWARLNNIGARAADGELLLFLNDDIEIIEGRWLEELVKQAVRDDIGSVGSLLLYPGGAIQHAGVFLVNFGGGCAHLFHKMSPGPDIYLRLDEVTREVSGNTGACLMVSKQKFTLLKGFDEELAVVGNDIDFCLRLIEHGYRNLWTPACKLIHHESISRKTSVPRSDEQGMWKRWKHKFEAGDTYYSPNLSTRDVDCSLNLSDTLEPLKALYCVKENSAVQNRKSPLQDGINLIGYIRAEMGLGEAARSDARALTAASIDFGIINFEAGNPASMTDLSWQHKEFFNPIFKTNLIHINGDHMTFVLKELPRYFFENRYNIGYWAWELAEIPDEWMSAFDHLDEIWAPSEFVRNAVAARSPVPVVRIPHCVAPKVEGNPTRDQFDLPDKPFLFLSMFDTRSMAQRKNPFGAIEAFCQAFDSDDESVCLVLKVNNADDPSLEEISGLIGERKNIVVFDKTLKKPEIDALLSVIDCYVSLHRSEGFGLPPAEAMSLGKAVILTNWSGSTDYMTQDNCMPIDYSLVELNQDIGPYKAGQVWAEPDLDQAATAMRRLASEPDLVKTIGDNARQTILSQFSPAVVGKLMLDRLEQIKSSRNPA